MLVSHAEPMTSVSPTFSARDPRDPSDLRTLRDPRFWPRARALALSTVETLAQARCGLGGHSMAMKFEKTRVSLECMSCGHNTPGWTIQART